MTLEEASKHLVIHEPFFGLFLMQLHKEFTNDIDTLCVAPHNTSVKLLINNDFWKSLTDFEQIAVLKHELSHICFKHIFMQKYFSDKYLFNIAADMEVNSYISNLPNDSVTADMISEPGGLGTKNYYSLLQNKNINIPNPEHHWELFKELSEEARELISNQIDYNLKENSNQIRKMNGKIPGQFNEIIDNLFKIKQKIFDWKSYFRNLMSNAIDIRLKKSHRRESLRFAGGADIRYKKKTSILIAIDTSGSISNEELCDFFSEVHHIYKAGADIRILECDTIIQRNYKYNGKWDCKCSGRGGTILKECSDYYMNHLREYSKFIIFTDGYFNIDEIQTPKNNNIFIITSSGLHADYPGKTIYIPKINNE